ncbi:hypothetical protein CPB85DRAFT_916895 [Mucidula mucida]|nr:hypothetical protein CPB85DRAFT_916895 [Mucidula mucida]
MEGEKNNWMVAAFVVTAFLNFATGYLRLRHLAPGDYLAMLSIGMLVVAGTASVVTTFRLRESWGGGGRANVQGLWKRACIRYQRLLQKRPTMRKHKVE